MKSSNSQPLSTLCPEREPDSLPSASSGLKNLLRELSLRYPELDGLRGFAVLLVVFGHYSLYFPEGSKIFGNVAKTGVWLFFILSSFLLTRQMTLVLSVSDRLENIGRYLARRVLRILPLFYSTLALLTLLPKFEQAMFGGRGFSLMNHALLLYPEGIFWAISVEFEYYLAIPVIALCAVALRRLHGSLGVVFGVLLLGIAWRAYTYAWFDIGFPVNYPHLANYLHFFLIGSAFAILFLHRSTASTVGGRAAALALCVGGAIQVFILPLPVWTRLMESLGVDNAVWHWLAQHPGQMISCSGILLGSLYSSFWKRVFSSSPLRFFGRVSFSLYCLHILPAAYLGFLVEYITPFGAVSVFFAASTLLSLVAFRFIEKPFMNLVRGPEQNLLRSVDPKSS